MIRRLLAYLCVLLVCAGAWAQPGPNGGPAGLQYPLRGPATASGSSGPGATNGLPSLDLNFLSGVLDPRISFTRGTGPATYFDSAGVLQTSRVNLLTNSQVVNSWPTKTDTTIADNNTTAPDGTMTGALATEGVAATAIVVSNVPVVAASSTVTFSVYLQRGNTDLVRILGGDTNAGFTNGIQTWVNLATGVASNTALRGTATSSSVSVQSVGNGWYRVTATCTLAVGSAGAVIGINTVTAAGGTTRVNNGTYYVWGGQIELGATASNYIPTTSVASGAPRFDYDPSTARTNLVTNSGSLSSFVPAASSFAAAQTTAPDGTLTAGRLTEDNTAGSEHDADFAFPAASVTGSTTFTGTVYAKADTRTQVAIAFRVGGSWTGSNAIVVADLSAVTVTPSGGATASSITAVGNGWYRIKVTATTVAAPTTAIFRLNLASAGAVSYNGNGTGSAFFWGAQLEVGSPESGYIPTTSVAAGAYATPRGLLIEEARTNSLRNSTAVGAVPGSPGTQPTNWSVAPANGLAVTIATGTAGGYSYVDYRICCTTAGAGTFTNIQLETASGLAAADAQTWAESVRLQLIAGSWTNVSVNSKFRGGLYAAAAAYLGELGAGSTALTAVGATPVSLVNTGTIATGPTTVALAPYFQIVYAGGGGVAIDFTLRIMGPQAELGAFATSFIPTSTVAATRAADVASISTAAPWFNAAAGTLVVEAVTNGALANSPTVIGADAGNPNLGFGTDGRLSASIRGVAGVLFGTGPVMTVSTVNKFGWAYKSGGSIGAVNGVAATGGNAAATFAVAGTKLQIGSDGVTPGANALNGTLRRVRDWPRAQLGPEMQNNTLP